jgi:hypothetical protein
VARHCPVCHGAPLPGVPWRATGNLGAFAKLAQPSPVSYKWCTLLGAPLGSPLSVNRLGPPHPRLTSGAPLVSLGEGVALADP